MLQTSQVAGDGTEELRRRAYKRMKTITTLIMNRRSCRSYTDESLSRERLTDLINAAVWVPNGSNNQPWRFVVITDRALMKKYSDAAKSDWLASLAETPHLQQYEKALRDPEYNIFYNAPALVIIYGNSESYWHVYDCSMVAYNLHLLAEESGMGACWIGFAHNIFATKEQKVEFGIPESYELVAPVILGHPTASHPTMGAPRKPFSVHFYDGAE
jgi:nitroreductase